MYSIRKLALALIAAVAMPAMLTAQEPAAESQAELAQIQSRLQQIQAQALQEPELRVAEQALNARLMETMAEVDPEFPARSARAEALKAEVEAAREAQDNAKLNELAAEAEELQASFAATRQRALQQEAMAAETLKLRQQIVGKMMEINPETEQLITRLQEITTAGQ